MGASALVTCVIVNDASCLIDLRKGRLLRAMLELPYRFVVPYPVRVDELLDFTPLEWDMLEAGGLEVFDLAPAQVRASFEAKRRHPRLSAHDCMCLVSAKVFDEAILLTGDRLLRGIAQREQVRVHGVLWIIDQLREMDVASEALITEALRVWNDDPSVFLPKSEIDRRRR